MKKAKILNAFNSLYENFKATIVECYDEQDALEQADEQQEVNAEAKTYALKDDPAVTVVVDEEGNVTFSDGREVVDGEYPLDADLVLVIAEGKGEVKPIEVKEDEAPVEAPLDDVAELKEEFAKQISEKDNVIAEAEKKVEELNAQMEQFSAVKTEMEKTIADLTAEVENLKSQLPAKVGEFTVQQKEADAKDGDLWSRIYNK